MYRRRYIYGLEVGTAKLCAMAGEMDSPDSFRVVAAATARSHGLRKGTVVDQEALSNEVRELLARFEEEVDDEIGELYLVVSSPHVQGRENRVVSQLSGGPRAVQRSDVEQLINTARTVTLDPQSVILAAEIQRFKLDEQEGIVNPVGMIGSKLELGMHMVVVRNNCIAPFANVVRSLSLEVVDVTFAGTCAASAVLSEEERELGAIVIDMGAGVTNYVAYYRGGLVAAGALGVGGDHVTNDIAHALNVGFTTAEEIKVNFGSAVYSAAEARKEFLVDLGATTGKRTFQLGKLQMVMQCRYEEIFKIIAEEIGRVIPLQYFRSGVYLCGGCAHTPRLDELAKRVFRLQPRIAKPKTITSLSSQLLKPEYAACVGLMHHAYLKELRRRKKPVLGRSFRDLVSQLTGAMRNTLMNLV